MVSLLKTKNCEIEKITINVETILLKQHILSSLIKRQQERSEVTIQKYNSYKLSKVRYFEIKKCCPKKTNSEGESEALNST